MYYLIIWDKSIAAAGKDGALEKLEIPQTLVKSFFNLDAVAFPKLSELSFDDYDLFSNGQMESLIAELQQVNLNAPSTAAHITSMVEMISRAKAMDKSVLFDPFRSE
jgi:hypothetical protein